jgi:DNA-binding beta-propeller fold protein YncE
VLQGPNTRLALPSAVAVNHRGSIFVANEGSETCTPLCGCVPNGRGASITVYAPGSKGDIKPVATIGGKRTQLYYPGGIALDSKGNIYVLNDDVTNFSCGGIFFLEGTQPILIFAPDSNGDAAPIAAIGGPFTGLDILPGGIAIGPAGP